VLAFAFMHGITLGVDGHHSCAVQRSSRIAYLVRLTNSLKGSMPVVGAVRPITRAAWTSYATR
jgi:hypothetical protein